MCGLGDAGAGACGPVVPEPATVLPGDRSLGTPAGLGLGLASQLSPGPGGGVGRPGQRTLFTYCHHSPWHCWQRAVRRRLVRHWHGGPPGAEAVKLAVYIQVVIQHCKV